MMKLYGIRIKGEDWKFTASKRDRDFLWDNIQRYAETRDEWEICEKEISTPALKIVPRDERPAEAA